MWNQVYNPLDNAALSTLAAALPVVTLLALIASNKVKAPIAAIAALLVAIGVAVYIFTMPIGLAVRAHEIAGKRMRSIWTCSRPVSISAGH